MCCGLFWDCVCFGAVPRHMRHLSLGARSQNEGTVTPDASGFAPGLSGFGLSVCGCTAVTHKHRH